MSLTLLKLANVFLRIGGIGSKFIILTLMSKYFDVDVFGNYGLITSFITILIFVLGVDFYNYSIRDILNTKNKQDIVNKIISSLFLYVIIYILFTVTTVLFLSNIPYIKPFIYLVIGLGITEHFSQESYRLLIGFKKVLFANVILFTRTSGWSIIIVYKYYSGISISINDILGLWLVFNIGTIAIVLLFGILVVGYKYLINTKVVFSWIKSGLRVAAVFMIATVSLKLIEYANRFIVDYFMGREMAGVFLFYSNISMLTTVYVNTIVISFELPELIASVKSPLINSLIEKFRKSLLKHVLIASVFLLISIKPLLNWQNKTTIESYTPLFFFLLIGVGLMNYSLVNHFRLYIFHHDKLLFKTMVLSAVFSLILSVIFIFFWGIYGAGFSFVLSSIILYLMRYNAVKKTHYD